MICTIHPQFSIYSIHTLHPTTNAWLAIIITNAVDVVASVSTRVFSASHIKFLKRKQTTIADQTTSWLKSVRPPQNESKQQRSQSAIRPASSIYCLILVHWQTLLSWFRTEHSLHALSAFCCCWCCCCILAFLRELWHCSWNFKTPQRKKSETVEFHSIRWKEWKFVINESNLCYNVCVSVFEIVFILNR